MNAEHRPYRGGRVDPPPTDERPDPGRCLAHGCPLRGSIDPGSSGRFMCAAHAWVPADRWQAITHQLHEHRWMADHMRSLRADDMHTRWRAAADAFWREADPDMVPDPHEGRELYLYRLHLDLLYRIGARLLKPGPMVPQGHGRPKRPGSLAGLLPMVEETAA
ncbi:MAG: hypothetical protein RJA36_292 [Pseudomonadota bacterium]|jgi:hypothetical protein